MNAYRLLNGDSAELLKQFPDNHFDSIVTDPPYLIGFLGKEWDAKDNFQEEVYRQCLRVLKPGGHILAFSAARTYHHLAMTLERVGFEVRDQLMWIYSSGFPKSQDIGRQIQKQIGVKETKAHKNNSPRIGGVAQGQEMNQQEQIVCVDPQAKKWSGWGTALKPAHEPICMARKPLKQSIAKNVQQYGTGALNIDATRVPYEDAADASLIMDWKEKWGGNQTGGAPVFQGADDKKSSKPKPGTIGTRPPNLSAIGTKSVIETSDEPWLPSDLGRFPSNVIGEIADYQKYFYCPKVSRRERHIGFENNDGDIITTEDMVSAMGGKIVDNKMANIPHLGLIHLHGIKHEYEQWCIKNDQPKGSVGNNHPTVKPVALMEYLIKLITPPGGTVLDPFNGSGSTGMAAVGLGFNYIGCDLDVNYIDISRRRIDAWVDSKNSDKKAQQTKPTADTKTKPKTLFDQFLVKTNC